MTPGATLGGKYRLLRLLGTGSMGEVWAALQGDLGREVAVKVIHDDHPELAARLKREGQACARLEHPNIVRLYDLGEDDEGRPYLVMEVLTGETLAARLARGRLPVAEALAVGAGIARALRAAHEAGIVHRDLKPANVYLHRGPGTDAEIVKVLDFGVSKILAPDAPRFTATGALMGSPAYMSPEQAATPRDTDARADLWSLGILLFEMLAGQRPFLARTALAVLADLLEAPIPRLASVAKGIDPRLDALVHGCLTRDVALRTQTATAVLEALTPLLAEAERAAAGRGPPGGVKEALRRVEPREVGDATAVEGARRGAAAYPRLDSLPGEEATTAARPPSGAPGTAEWADELPTEVVSGAHALGEEDLPTAVLRASHAPPPPAPPRPPAPPAPGPRFLAPEPAPGPLAPAPPAAFLAPEPENATAMFLGGQGRDFQDEIAMLEGRGWGGGPRWRGLPRRAVLLVLGALALGLLAVIAASLGGGSPGDARPPAPSSGAAPARP